jgi:hypothetical protein
MAKGGKLPPGTRRTWGGEGYIKPASGERGRYMAEKNNGKWYDCQLSEDELKAFVAESLAGKENKKAFIGTIASEAVQRIEAVCGKKVGRIVLESEAVRHSINKASHNLHDGDLLRLVNVINTATDIKNSQIHHQNNKCLEITQDIDGNITFVVEVRVKFGGWLALVTCYRQKK